MGTHLHKAMRAYRPVLARLLTCALALAVVALLALPACTTQAPPAPTPTTGANLSLTSVALLSAQDGWVVSAGSMVPPAYELHLQQGVWIRVPLGDSADGLNKVVLLSPTDGWAVGENVYHFDGTRWMRVYASHRPQVQELGLTDAAFLSPTEGWAVGWGGILHYHGGQWTDVSAGLPQVPTPTPGTTYTGPGLRALALVSPTEGWAVGALVHEKSGDTEAPSVDCSISSYVLHLSGGLWTAVPVPNVGVINGLAFDSPDDGWAAADGGLLHHYHAGTWTAVLT